jgi:hypothetical protein
MALPWNEGSMEAFPNEGAVKSAIAEVKSPGIYTIPAPQGNQGSAQAMEGPLVFASIHPGPMTGMGQSIVFQLVLQ